jgi:hypothetical protein
VEKTVAAIENLLWLWLALIVFSILSVSSSSSAFFASPPVLPWLRVPGLLLAFLSLLFTALAGVTGYRAARIPDPACGVVQPQSSL